MSRLVLGSAKFRHCEIGLWHKSNWYIEFSSSHGQYATIGFNSLLASVCAIITKKAINIFLFFVKL